MAKLNVTKTIRKYQEVGRINTRYDLTVHAMNEIRENFPNPFQQMCATFVFGYAQGRKAARAEMKGGENL